MHPNDQILERIELLLRANVFHTVAKSALSTEIQRAAGERLYEDALARYCDIMAGPPDEVETPQPEPDTQDEDNTQEEKIDEQIN